MKHISILVPQQAVIEAIADPQYLFTTANHFLASQGKAPLFKVELIGTGTHVDVNHTYSVRTDGTLDQSTQVPDLVIIPALGGDMTSAIHKNRALIPWIKKQYENGSEVASLCVGAFLLGATGLLDGRSCSTHWGFMNEFRSLYPDIKLVDGGIITEDERLYTSGGANSYWNLLIYLLEKYTDRETAILAAKYFAIDIDRDSQNAFVIFHGQKDHEDADIIKIQEYIETNYADKISIDLLAGEFGIGRRSLERRFKKATHNTLSTYIQRVKIEAAKRSFENTRKNINEVMYDVGYTDTKAFRDVFKKITGLTPIDYRNKYNKIGLN